MLLSLRRETLSLFGVLIVLSTTVIWIRTLTVKETYAYVRQEGELRRSEQTLQSERLRLVRTTSPARLQARAVEMDLALPRAQQVVKWQRYAKRLTP